MPERLVLKPGSAISFEVGNWAILALAVIADVALLWVASHTSSALLFLGAAALFAFTNNCLFSLMHEAVHAKFAEGAKPNRLAGTIAAAFFPTSFTLQRSAHLTHHRNNRSDLERFDFIGPAENIPLKTAQWFSILTGLYWAGIPIVLSFYVLFAELIPWRRLIRPGSRFAAQTSAGEFLDSLMRLPLWTVRAEFLLALAVHLSLAWGLGLSIAGWAACYGAFALAWSSLQYADHAFTRLDRAEGAWNLRVGWFTRRMFLNYHDHLEHHRDPQCRWRDLPGKARASDPPFRFLAILYLMWEGPQLLPGSHQAPSRQRLLEWSVVACHATIFGAAFQLVYGLSSLRYPLHGTYHSVAVALDRTVPFVASAGWIYISIVPLLMLTPLILRTPKRTLPFLATLLLQLMVAGLTFELFPVETPTPPGVDAGRPGALAFGIADAINLNGNLLPSLHVALSVSCAWAVSPRLAGVGRVAIWTWVAAICASTLLIRQHWVVDVLAGAALGAVAMGLVYPRLISALVRVEADLIANPASYVGKS